MLRILLLPLAVALTFSCCSYRQDTTKRAVFSVSITRVEMYLSAFGVESDNFPSIEVYIDFANDSSNCSKSYYNPAFKPSAYKLPGSEIKKVLQLLEAPDLEKLKAEYAVSKTDQPTSTTKVFAGHRTFVIKDYGLEGGYPLQELYKIVYKY